MYRGLLTKEEQRRRKRRRRLCRRLGALALCAAACLCIAVFLGRGESRASERAAVVLIEETIPEAYTAGPAAHTQARPEMIEEIPLSRESLLVVIDPGHGGIDEGASKSGILEKDVNLQIALLAEKKLQALGYRTALTRETDKEVSLEERVDFANRKEADLFLSIHQNASESSQAKGMEVWYGSREDKRLAELINKYMLRAAEGHPREMKNSTELFVLQNTNMPACLAETGFLTNEEERRALLNEEYREKIAEGIAEGVDLYFFPKTMYLTFDDGPSEENTEAILDVLKEKNVKATFFLVGENVEKHPEIAKRIAQEGHTVGIHCYNHNYDFLYDSAESFLADFEKAYDVIRRVTGVEAKLFRFPGGSINAYNQDVYEEIIDEMTGRGYIYFDWNASLEDARKHTSSEELLKNAKESTLERKKVIMLAHDIVADTALCMEELLEQFPEYEMLPLSEDVSPIQF